MKGLDIYFHPVPVLVVAIVVEEVAGVVAVRQWVVAMAAGLVAGQVVVAVDRAAAAAVVANAAAQPK